VKTTFIKRALPSGLVLMGARAGVAQLQTAKVAGGQLEGVVSGGVAAFKGIPFAAPPVGDLRWKAPQAALPWGGV
jgi:para-nitrobenzyl esterase